MTTLKIDVSDEVAELVEHEGAEEMLVMELFRRGRISTGKACELLRLDRVAFARRASELEIPYFLMNKDDWNAEKATIDAWLRS